MKKSLGLMALVAVGIVGCNKGEENNAPKTPLNQEPSIATNAVPSANNEPSNSSNNAPDATNSGASNSPVSSNSPDSGKPSAATNSPDSRVTANNSPVDANKPKDLKHPKDLKGKPLSIIPDVDPMGQNGWTKTQLEAKKIAAEADAQMKAVKNVRLRTREDFSVGEFSGYFNNFSLIADQKRYLLNYATTVANRADSMDSFIVRKQDNGEYGTLVGGGYKPGRIPPDPDILKGWALSSTHYITDSVGTDHKAFTNLVTAAQKAQWKITVEKKAFARADYIRVIMESSNAPKKRYEFLVEPVKKLPVQFNSVVYDKKKMSSALMLGWDQSDKPLTDKDLTPKIDTQKVKAMTPEEAKKSGIKLPEKKS